ncbi:MAG TPA: aminotransferase class V-fold PLP-dependent enzyme [Acidimicrobiales bacterium]|nr:aminotransferase class V-fold PLP-dependent enzyme [Acidimicrobiales bacterium]
MENLTGQQVGARLRAETPAITLGESKGWCYFDGPSGTQMIDRAMRTMRVHVRTGMSNRHGFSPPGDDTEAFIARARMEIKALYDADDYEVVFGQNMTSLAFTFSHALARAYGRDNRPVVVTELEHRANVDPWLQAFATYGTEPSWLKVDEHTLQLRRDDIDRLGDGPGPALIAVTAASNAIGMRPDLAELSAIARAQGSLLVVDAVHCTPHGPPSLRELRPDILLSSAYKFYGPHVGVALVRSDLCEELEAFKVEPAPSHGPEKFETGSQNHEAIAGLVGALDGLAALVGEKGGEGARTAINALSEYEEELANELVSNLEKLPSVRVFRGSDANSLYTPTIAMSVDRIAPGDLATALRERGVFVTAGDFYATPLASRLGVGEKGGWMRLGVAGYTTPFECEYFLNSLREIVE